MSGNSDQLQIIHGVCAHDCPDTCSWKAEVSNGQAVRLYGDPQHPFTRGVLCAKVSHYLERVYHPERLQVPLRRTGRKGAGQFEEISWDAALAEIANRWRKQIEEFGAETILPFSSAGNQGLIQHSSLDMRLFGLMGCSRLERNICGNVAHEGLCATQGCGTGINPEDLVHSRLIVLWGTNTLVTNSHLWPVIQESRRHGGRVIVVDPIRTRTASAADQHLAVRPGTDTVLMLAMMHIIIRDGLTDEDYIQRYSEGFAELSDHVRQYTPELAATVTGLSVEQIEAFAREYATVRPAVLRPLIGLEHHPNGAMMFRTLACLPVITGAWRYRGGGLARSTGAFQFSALNTAGLLKPETWQPDCRSLNMRDLGRILHLEADKGAVRSLLVYNSNPAVTMPNQNLVRRGLQREDLFTVVHDLFLTETARFADLVLPATSQLEHLDIVPSWGHHYLSLNRPAIAPCGQSVCNTELFRRLAAAMGRDETWLYESDEQLLRTALDSGHPMLEGITLESLLEHGYLHLNHAPDWMPFAAGGFATPSGRARLFASAGSESGAALPPVPGEIPVRPPGRLQLVTGKTLHFLNSSYSHQEPHRRRAGQLTVQMHEEDAAERELQHGDSVILQNEQGSVRAICSVSPHVQRGVISIPFGGLQDASGESVGVNILTPEWPTDWGGGSGFYACFVEVSAEK